MTRYVFNAKDRRLTLALTPAGTVASANQRTDAIFGHMNRGAAEEQPQRVPLKDAVCARINDETNLLMHSSAATTATTIDNGNDATARQWWSSLGKSRRATKFVSPLTFMSRSIASPHLRDSDIQSWSVTDCPSSTTYRSTRLQCSLEMEHHFAEYIRSLSAICRLQCFLLYLLLNVSHVPQQSAVSVAFKCRYYRFVSVDAALNGQYELGLVLPRHFGRVSCPSPVGLRLEHGADNAQVFRLCNDYQPSSSLISTVPYHPFHP
ncbi:unnamed protein product [Soboliphyme baturini]|uniref:Uncharacterized protein n=1 Tax=Soboliphyme baturini TaxID=241478 RepID=A0A183IPN5_9BILA|nr:unnamed protein product [Soboliphyme baturini]